MVRVAGLEPAASASQARRSTKLSYTLLTSKSIGGTMPCITRYQPRRATSCRTKPRVKNLSWLAAALTSYLMWGSFFMEVPARLELASSSFVVRC
jgi:hypothetical protein